VKFGTSEDRAMMSGNVSESVFGTKELSARNSQKEGGEGVEARCSVYSAKPKMDVFCNALLFLRRNL
jgi:hypothetical protein